MTPTTYTQNLQAHATCTCFCSGGTIVIKHDGNYYTYKEFYETFPIHPVAVRTRDNYKGPNSDKTKDWMTIN